MFLFYNIELQCATLACNFCAIELFEALALNETEKCILNSYVYKYVTTVQNIVYNISYITHYTRTK